MTGYVLSPAAQSDLEQIWDYTAANWSVEQAEHYVRAIQGACLELAEGKRFSRDASDIRPGYRKASEGSHVLFFRQTDTGVIDIVRILHQRMDMPRHF